MSRQSLLSKIRWQIGFTVNVTATAGYRCFNMCTLNKASCHSSQTIVSYYSKCINILQQGDILYFAQK